MSTHIFVANVQQYPELKKKFLGLVSLKLTRHAEDRARERYIFIPRELDIRPGMIVETEIEKETKAITKVIVRYPSRTVEGSDDVLVLVRKNEFPEWLVVSAYRNASDDHHETLRVGRLGQQVQG